MACLLWDRKDVHWHHRTVKYDTFWRSRTFDWNISLVLWSRSFFGWREIFQRCDSKGEGLLQNTKFSFRLSSLSLLQNTFNGSAPDVFIVNAGCGRYGLLSNSEKPSEGVTKSDLEELKSNLQTSYHLLCSALPEVAVPNPGFSLLSPYFLITIFDSCTENKEEAPQASPCHVIVLGSNTGINRETAGGESKRLFFAAIHFYYYHWHASLRIHVHVASRSFYWLHARFLWLGN